MNKRQQIAVWTAIAVIVVMVLFPPMVEVTIYARTGKTVLPRVHDDGHAIWRRLRIVPFTVTIPEEEQDKHLTEKLVDEWPGILAWLVRGCVEWQQQGLGEPVEVGEATATYKQQEEPLADFLADRCILSREAKVSRVRLWQTYTRWIKDLGERHPIGRTGFYEQIRRQADVAEQSIIDCGTETRGFVGIGVITPVGDPTT